MRIPTTLLALLLVLGAGCGDDDGGAATTTSTTTTSEPAAAEPSRDPAIAALGDQEICDRLPAADVGAALGLVIAEGVGGGSMTAQCVYNYETGAGTTSNVSVASLTSEIDLGGRTGDEAFDHLVGLFLANVDGGIGAVEVEAGDRAVRIDDGSFHIGVLAVDDRLFNALVPVGDVEAAGMDDLLVIMADRLGG